MTRHAFFRPWVILVLLLTSTLAQALEPPRLPLWEARNAQGTLYLFGSIHVCNASCYPLPRAALDRFAQSQSLVVELDPRNEALQAKLMAAARLPDNRTLPELLAPADWKSVETAATRLQLPPQALAPLQPWMAGLVLTLTAGQQAGLDVSQGIDQALIAQAEARTLPLEELETIDEQLTALTAGTTREQHEALRLIATQINSGRAGAYLNDLRQAWQAGDTPTIERLLKEDTPKNSQLERALFDDRNRHMAERIIARMQDGQTRFVVVGIGHLVGPRSVPALLRQKGYRVRQLTAKDTINPAP